MGGECLLLFSAIEIVTANTHLAIGKKSEATGVHPFFRVCHLRLPSGSSKALGKSLTPITSHAFRRLRQLIALDLLARSSSP